MSYTKQPTIVVNVNLPEDVVTRFALYINICELILILGSLPLVFSLIYVFTKSSLFHRNLRILIVNVGVEFFILSTSRLFVLIGDIVLGREEVASDHSASQAFLVGPFSAAEMIRLVACSAFILNAPICAIERFCATIYFRTYEFKKNNRLLALGISAQWILGAFCTFIFLNGGTLILILAEFSLMIFSGIVSFQSEYCKTRKLFFSCW